MKKVVKRFQVLPAKTKHIFTVVFVILIIWLSAVKTEALFPELWTGIPNMWDLLKQMFPPNWSYIDNITPAMLETIRMAVLGTTFGSIIAIPIALLCASNIVKSTVWNYPVRFILNLIRTVPDLLLAAIFVAIFRIRSTSWYFSLVYFLYWFSSKAYL